MKNHYPQVKELVEHWVQSLQLDLSALALGQGEEVVGAQLHDDKRVTQTLEATREVRGTEKPPPHVDLNRVFLPKVTFLRMSHLQNTAWTLCAITTL